MKKLLAASLLLLVSGGSAFAQMSSTSTTQTDSAAQAIAAPSINFNSSSATHTSQTVRNTPDASGPGLFAGTNPCAVGVSGGIGLPGFGIGGGATFSDSGCERRNMAGALYTMGLAAAAKEVLCANDEVRTAFIRVRQPCAIDLPGGVVAAASPPAPMAAAAPLPPAASNATTVIAGPRNARTAFIRPDWCETVDVNNAMEVARTRAACGG
ncbi:hypothetical protein QMO56_12200 [Roseomonas sp. E05]|uniref:hypothetical protein n=1 Tax=Roseomonas sp. E05 TaxID=3046310 RepID=UPI0024B9A724|nr:hypothetical protein [Roseomonas sp. E05]MDJ0388877.1 hypothetical protein [Roseomonas sp. E05]